MFSCWLIFGRVSFLFLISPHLGLRLHSATASWNVKTKHFGGSPLPHSVLSLLPTLLLPLLTTDCSMNLARTQAVRFASYQIIRLQRQAKQIKSTVFILFQAEHWYVIPQSFPLKLLLKCVPQICSQSSSPFLSHCIKVSFLKSCCYMSIQNPQPERQWRSWSVYSIYMTMQSPKDKGSWKKKREKKRTMFHKISVENQNSRWTLLCEIMPYVFCLKFNQFATSLIFFNQLSTLFLFPQATFDCVTIYVLWVQEFNIAINVFCTLGMQH